jgi:hypothetical protein
MVPLHVWTQTEPPPESSVAAPAVRQRFQEGDHVVDSAASLGRRQDCLAPQHLVVLARVGVELRVLELEALQCLPELGECKVGVAQDIRAIECLALARPSQKKPPVGMSSASKWKAVFAAR